MNKKVIYNWDIRYFIEHMRSAKRILILGSPGSGKTYISKVLQKYLNLPSYHMDDLYWREEWCRPSDRVFCKCLTEIMDKDSWILEGNYHKYMLKDRIKVADIVILLDIPTAMCGWRILSRWGKIAFGDTSCLPLNVRNSNHVCKNKNRIDVSFLGFVLGFKRNVLPFIYSIIRECGEGKTFILNWSNAKTAVSTITREL